MSGVSGVSGVSAPSLTVMELLSCLTLCSSCSRSTFSSELHFISFCFSSSLAETERDDTAGQVMLAPGPGLRGDNKNLTFFVGDVGMDYSQGSRPGNGFFFLQDLESQQLFLEAEVWKKTLRQTRLVPPHGEVEKGGADGVNGCVMSICF